MTDLRVIGIDPGPVPGIVVLHIQNGRITRQWTHAVQCSWPVCEHILSVFLRDGHKVWPRTLVQVERFVVGRRSGRSSSAGAGAVTRDLVGIIQAVIEDQPKTGHPELRQRSAAAVKPWATDARLEAAGLLEATKGMRHARDAARHAIFAACHDGGLPDPLSKGFRR